jgi:hypothetical protein
VCLRGASVNSVTIRSDDVSVNTVAVTAAANTRIEDVTIVITTSTDNVNITGLEIPSGAQPTCKLRSAVISVTSTASSGVAYGILSSGTSAITYSSADLTRGCTINVDVGSGTNNIARGVYINGVNRISIRDTNVFVKGSGSGTIATATDISGATAYMSVITSSLNGQTYDIARTDPSGTLLLHATNLVNGTTDGNSFAVTTQASNLMFGTVGSINTATKYLLPGTVDFNALPTTSFPFKFDQTIVPFYLVFNAGTALTGLDTAVLEIHKNNTAGTPIISATLDASNQSVVVNNKSATITPSDSLIAQLVTSGSIGTNTLIGTLGVY